MRAESFYESIIVLHVMPVGAGVVKCLFASGRIFTEWHRLGHLLIAVGEGAFLFSDARVGQPIPADVFFEVLRHEVDLVEVFVETMPF